MAYNNLYTDSYLSRVNEVFDSLCRLFDSQCSQQYPPRRIAWWSTIYFFFQAEDGIRDYKVTGVQTCALPISRKWPSIHSRVKSFGTPRTKASSLRSSPSASANHVRYVVSLSAPLSRPATSFHRDRKSVV